jgi:hypothetical protein
MDYAIVKNGLVINAIVLDEQTAWEPPDGGELVELQDCAGIGWGYVNGSFIAPSDTETVE